MVKISGLPSDSSPSLTDYIPTLDIETSTTKRVLLSNLLSLFSPFLSFKRQNDTTNTSVLNGRMEIGHGVLTNTTGSPAMSESVTFNTAFTSTPIIYVSIASDSSTNTGYGTGGNTVEGRLLAKSAGQSTTGFTIWIHTGGGNNFGAGFTYYTWMAVGS